MKTIKLILATIILAFFAGCANDDNYSTPNLEGNCKNLTPTVEVSTIISAATNTMQQYVADDILEVYVTSSDEGGNFYKSISFVSIDNQRGFSMPIDDYNLYTKFPPGKKVYIKMDSLYYQNRTVQTRGLQIGANYDGNVGRIAPISYRNIIIPACEDSIEEDLILNTITIAEAKNDFYLNKLIEIENIQFTSGSNGKYYDDAYPNLNYSNPVYPSNIGGATNHNIEDAEGNKLIVRISQYSTFASEPVPNKSGKVRGVLTKYGNDYQFMIRTVSDVDLTGERFFIPTSIGGTNIQFLSNFTENFESYSTSGAIYVAGTRTIFPKYINDAPVGTRYWATAEFGGNKYIQMSAFNASSECKSYFIVPANLTNAALSFKTKDGYYTGAALKVYYSTDYVAHSNIANATLVDITSNFAIASGSTSGYATNFTNSGNYTINAGGNGFIIFEYSGSSSGVTTTYQIDDIVVQ